MGEFENEASKLFIQLFHQFEAATEKLNRRQDENVFQQAAARYTASLKQQLSQVALRLMQEHQHAHDNLHHLQHTLTHRIEVLLNEFSQKTQQW